MMVSIVDGIVFYKVGDEVLSDSSIQSRFGGIMIFSVQGMILTAMVPNLFSAHLILRQS